MRRAILTAALFLLPLPAMAAKTVAATVNGSAILREDLTYEMGRSQRQEGGVDEGEALERLIRRELLRQAAQEARMTPPAAAVEDELARMRRMFVSPAAFERELAALGLSEAAVRRQVEEGLAIAAFVEMRFLPQTTVTAQELRAWFEEHPEEFRRPARVRASHILVRVAPGWEEARKERAREKITMLHGRLRKGEAFAALARQFSECFSAPGGGDLGYFMRREMEEPFAAAAFALRPGETSGMVECRDGYHLIRVTDVEPAAAVPFEEAAPVLERRLRGEKARIAAMRYAGELRAKAEVVIAPATGN